MQRYSKYCTFIVISSFYFLFFSVPLLFTSITSELFEFNKMWIVYAITLLISTTWLIDCILNKNFFVKKTILDVPISLFFLFQLIATFFSIDTYISFWGYYSRFNGGLLSTLCYILLYYAFTTYISKKHVIRLLTTSIITCFITCLWGIPSHFGYDPTCYIFRGTFDVSCWTSAFKPQARIFSTLGQPDWFAAYLAIILFFSFPLLGIAHQEKKILKTVFYFITIFLSYISLLYTQARSGFLAFWVALVVFAILFFIKNYAQIRTLPFSTLKNTYFLIISVLITLGISTFFIGTPFEKLNILTYQRVVSSFQSPHGVQKNTDTPLQHYDNTVTDSGTIRLIVWQGAIEAWKHSPLIGTGVETFAFAYYRYRPISHNMTSEWDYLYNKAHNEYLNYLTTTGILGLLTYCLVIISICLYVIFKKFPPQVNRTYGLIIFSLLGSYITILLSNFFGFSVVIVNLYFFIIPACILILSDNPLLIKLHIHKLNSQKQFSLGQHVLLGTILCSGLYGLFIFYQYWVADTHYALGSNFNATQQYQQAYQELHEAIALRDEPVFEDELSNISSSLALAYFQTKDATSAGIFAQEALQRNNDLISKHANNIVFWKSRVRIFYALAQVDSDYLLYALQALETVHKLSPTDAKVFYNLSLLYAQVNQLDKAITTAQEAIKLKSDYYDAYYALATFYHLRAVNSNGKIISPDYLKKAINTMTYINTFIRPNDPKVQKALGEWQKNI